MTIILQTNFKRTVVVASALFMFIVGHAQMGIPKGKIDDIERFTEKPLVVAFSKPDSSLVDTNFNDYFKKAVNAIWRLSPSVEFMTSEAYGNLQNDEDKASNYAYLDYIKVNHIGNAPAQSFIVGLMNERVSPYYTTLYTQEESYSYGDVYFYLTLLHNDLSDALNRDFKELKKERNSKFTNIASAELENKTLLLDETLIEEEVKEDIANIYPYKYKIVSKEDIDNAITQKQANTVILRKILSAPRPLMKTTQGAIIDGSRHANGMFKRYPDKIRETVLDAIYFHALYNTETGRVIFYGRPSFKDKKVDIKDFKTINKAID